MANLPAGLICRSQTGVYYLRRRIPIAVLACYPGKREVVHSLKTKDLAVATTRFRIRDGELAARWSRDAERLRRRSEQFERQPLTPLHHLSDEIVSQICQLQTASSLATDEKRRIEGDYDVHEIREYTERYRDANEGLKTALAIGDMNVLLPLLQQFVHFCGYKLAMPEEDMRRFALSYGHNAVQTNELLLQRYRGEYVPTPASTFNRDTPTLSVVIKAYLERYEKTGKHSMLRKIHAVLPLLLELIGDKPIGLLTQPDLVSFFETVENLPPRWKDVCRQRKITAREVAALGMEGISKGTFDGTYLAVLGPFVRYLNGHWSGHGWTKAWTLDGITYTGNRIDPEFFQGPHTHIL